MKTVRRFTTFQIIVFGFALVTLFSALLLTLPAATEDGRGQTFVDALFMATSAISTTGLVVVDPGTAYTLFGELVIIAVVQVGGLGYMIFIILFGYLLQRDPSLNLRNLMRDSLAGTQLAEMKRFVKLTLRYTFGIELLGGLVLAGFWLEGNSPLRALYLGMFHSVSAFCTAGFSLFPDSLMAMRDHVFFNLFIDFICLTGGIGFFVLYDVHLFMRKWLSGQRPRRLVLHTKLVFFTTLALVLGSSLFLLLNGQEFAVFPQQKSRILAATFQVVSASTTTGYNSIDIGAMQSSSLFLMAMLMIIGASPGSTGGGIKTSTLAVMVIYLKAILKGQKKVHVFRRQITSESIKGAFASCFLATILMSSALVFLIQTQGMGAGKLFFEVASAFGNAGLSTGITAFLTAGGKYIIILLMFIGRIGVMTVGYSLVGYKPALEIEYPPDEVFIG